MDHSENEDITLKRSDSTDKVLKPGVYGQTDRCISAVVHLFTVFKYSISENEHLLGHFM